MKETEQVRYNALRKTDGLGPVTNSEWDYLVKKSKKLTVLDINSVGASVIQENILDLLCRLQSAQDKELEEKQRVDAWIDKFNDVNSEKRNWKEKYNKLYPKVEHTIRKLATVIEYFDGSRDKLVLSNMQRCLDDLMNAMSGKEGISEEEAKAIIQERKDVKDGQKEDKQ